MKTKNETDLLNELIIATKRKRAYELGLMKEELQGVCESLKPLNLVKTIFHEVTNSPEVKSTVTNGAIGLGTGFFVKKLVVGNSPSFCKKVLGVLLQFGVANVVSKHIDEVKLIAMHLLNQNLPSSKPKTDYRNDEITS